MTPVCVCEWFRAGPYSAAAAAALTGSIIDDIPQSQRAYKRVGFSFPLQPSHPFHTCFSILLMNFISFLITTP